MKNQYRYSFTALLFLLILVSFANSASAQTGEVRGFVYDKETGEPIIFTNVFIRELKIGKATDINGFYAISRLKPGSYQIQCFFLGYDTAEATVQISDGKITNQNLYIVKRSQQLKEVSVSADKQKAQTETRVSNITITQRELKQLPSFGGEPDLAQYLQVLPGVVFSGDQGGQLYMRGGPPVQNRVLLDGMTIYNPFHSIGLFSVFDADIIRSADVYAGGFNAQYGGRIGSVIDVTTREGNKTRFSGKVNVNTITSKVLLEGPLSKFKDGSSSSVIVSYKTSYLDQTSKSIYSYAGPNGLPFSFSDLYGKFSFIGSNGSKFNVFGFNFSDGVKYPATEYNWNSWGLGTNFFLVPSGSTVINGTVAYSSYNTQQVESLDNLPRESSINTLNIGLNFTYFLGKDDIKYGFEMNAFNTDFTYVNGYGLGLSQTQSTTELCGFLKYKKTAGRFLIEPGLRLQAYASLGEYTLEPRLSAKYNLTEKIRLKVAGGYYTQNLMSATSDRDVVNLFYGFLSGPEDDVSNTSLGITNNSKLQKAIHYVGGVELNVGQHGSINMEGFYKDFLQLTVINRDKKFPNDQANQFRPEIDRVDYILEKGNAYGGDFLYKYDYKNIYLWFVYSLTFVKRNDGVREYFPSFDRRHNVNVVATYTFGRDDSWSFNTRWNFGSGFPFTQTQGFYEQLNYANGSSSNIYQQNGALGVYYTDINTGRLPYFHRLDLSLSKKIKTGKNSTLMVIASCTNVYNRSNVFYFDRITYQRVNQLPIMPTLGINFSF